ncbi:hypothetical protein SRABI27_03104 [Pedobacter sp. Bi27]|nr:hypothetical protein SRABI36_00567 [Pedobacter sp. Bi36]CAH0197716.1 hypothetical protein SRABI126_01661 [Pedobacter sp. Bi126]CAH0256548.1 hypothetical protein SRABI27_03104 [Pedobacter sp. Bi27]
MGFIRLTTFNIDYGYECENYYPHQVGLTDIESKIFV